MKVALITIFQVPNYGSVLQTFATQQILEQMGAEVHLINYNYPNEWHWQNGARKPSGIRTWIRKLIPSKKISNLDKFRSAYLHLTKCYDSLDALSAEDWSDYDAFVVGSDQVWNPRFLHGDKTFMLSFVPDNIPRYSLASSFATDTLPENLRYKYYRELVKFEAISVREQNGVKIINNELNINKNVEVILDPTLLFPKEDWLRFIPRSSFQKRKSYIVLYLLKYSFDPRPYIYDVVKYFQKKLDAEVIALCGYDKPEKTGGLLMENAFSSSVPRFIDIIANADLIVTNSFHGTAFGINFGIPLISIVPSGGDDDRQSTLLRSVCAENSICPIYTSISNIEPEYNRDTVSKRLADLRKQNISWIKSNIIM